jgi:hypothetical protein
MKQYANNDEDEEASSNIIYLLKLNLKNVDF